MSAALRRRLLGAVAWTALLALLVYGADRFLLGARSEGWGPAASLDAVPAAAGRLEVPGYLPEALSWPPSRILVRGGAAPGWWLGLADADGTPRLWLGTGQDPLPEALAGLAGCLVEDTRARCPSGWRALSTERAGRTVWVLGRVDALLLRRILDSLGRR